MFDNHSRFKVISELQHPYRHKLTDFTYTNPSLPNDVINAQQALDYVLAVLYPKTQPAVATVGDLPLVGNNAGDLRIVQDDGDGKAAQYMWSQYDGQPALQWNKVGDMDWGTDSVISGLLDQTQYLYPRKLGTTDYDPVTELPYAGDLAGQRIYGGDQANQHLTLYANNGDSAGNTGFVQVGDDFRPLSDLVFDLGEADKRFLNGYFGTLVVGTATMSITSSGVTGLITDTSGQISFDNENLLTTGNINGSIVTASTSLVAQNGGDSLTINSSSITSTLGSISFGDENLSTTGTMASGVHTIASDLVLGVGSITSLSGAISFGDENLTTTGFATAGQVNVDSIRLDNNRVSIETLNTDLELVANGTGTVDVLSAMTTLGVTSTGTVSITGDLSVDNITIDGSTISESSNLILTSADINPTADNVRRLGSGASRFYSIALSEQIEDGTNNFKVTDLMALRNNIYRDVARTQPAQTGDALFYDQVSGLWLASEPNTEIEHNELSGLTTGDAGHTQFAMLAGRTGGQVINGSDTTAQSLTLLDNSVDTKGLVISGSVNPFSDADTDLGAGGARFVDLYQSGQLIGSRFENTATLPATNAGEIGRQKYNTADGFLYISNGTSYRKVGNNSYNALHTDVELNSPIDVSATIGDARNALWQLCDTANNEILAVEIQKTATTVIVNDLIALPAGNYRLIGIEA